MFTRRGLETGAVYTPEDDTIGRCPLDNLRTHDRMKNRVAVLTCPVVSTSK